MTAEQRAALAKMLREKTLDEFTQAKSADGKVEVCPGLAKALLYDIVEVAANEGGFLVAARALMAIVDSGESRVIDIDKATALRLVEDVE